MASFKSMFKEEPERFGEVVGFGFSFTPGSALDRKKAGALLAGDDGIQAIKESEGTNRELGVTAFPSSSSMTRSRSRALSRPRHSLRRFGDTAFNSLCDRRVNGRFL